MSARIFQYLCGLTVLLTHIIGLAMIATASRFSETTDQIGSILMVVPITLVYASSFIKFVVNNPDKVSGSDAQQFDLLEAGTMYLVVFVFCASLFFVIINFVFFSSYKIDEFKMWLGVSESAFGALIGIVFERLFGVSNATANNVKPLSVDKVQSVSAAKAEETNSK
jgi:hypothetical protein